MSSMAQDAISYGLDPVIAPDGQEWCNSSYGQSSVSREIWGDLQSGCSTQERSDYGDDDSYDDEGDVEAHTEKVWERKGYIVKHGESYAYKFYGNEIYTEDQVIRKTDLYRKKRYKKSRESEMNTYDDWQALGYQVRKGESAIGGHGENCIFSRDQVAWIG